MTLEEHAIYKQLKDKPESMYIAPGSHQIYLWAEGVMVCMTTEQDLSLLNETELNAFIKEQISRFA